MNNIFSLSFYSYERHFLSLSQCLFLSEENMIHFFFKPVKLSSLPILVRVRSLPITSTFEVLPGDSGGKETACNVGDPSSIPRLGGSPGGGSGTLSSILA